MLKVRSIKINFILNGIRTILSVLIGLIIFPYVNKTLGVDSIGKYEYANTLITYFILFSNLGIPMYGIREIAKVRDDKNERTKVVIELFFILLITSIISYIILAIFISNVSSFQSYIDLLLIISPSIFLSCLGLEWFFQGIEDQMYITIRFLIVKLITLVLIFTLLEDGESTPLYAAIMTFSLVGANIFNFFYIKKFLDFSDLKIRDLNIKRHLKGILTIFLATISISIYLQVDTTLLGYFGNDKNVGLYTTANKLVRLATVFITTLGAVMLPRLSNLFNNNQIDEYYSYLKKSLCYILFLSIPISILIYCLSDKIINLMAGSEFKEAILVMEILAPLVLIIGIAYFLAFMILYPQGKEKYYTYVVFITALLSLVLNVIYIPQYFQIATAWINISVELLAVLIMLFLVKNDLNRIDILSFNNLKYIISGAFMFIVLGNIPQFFNNDWIILFLELLIALFVYILSLFFLKENIIMENYQKIVDKLKK